MGIIIVENSRIQKGSNSKTFIERAKNEIPRFIEHLSKFEEKITIDGYAPSTMFSYSRSLAVISLYFGKSPIELDSNDINTYLFKLTKVDSPSATYFKHMVYSLRFLFRLYNLDDKRIKLPKIKKTYKLPVVLSREEVRALLKTPKGLKQRVIFALIYSAGLRINEVCQLKISDIDEDRMQIRIKQSKGNKDRYVILSTYMLQGLRKYIQRFKPKHFLFYGHDIDREISKSAIRQSFKLAAKKAGIIKECSVHTLRHSYATHLLEDGVDIVSIKDLLGHSYIASTLHYLHVANLNKMRAHSPLDTLYSDYY